MTKTDTTDPKQAKMLERVRGLLAKADSTEFPEEADAFRAKADELMTAYAISAWDVQQAQDGVSKRPEPVSRLVDISWYKDSPLKDQLWALCSATAEHCRVVLVHYKPEWGQSTVHVPAVGLPADLDYFDMLFTSLMLQMGKQLEPKFNDRLTEAENIAAFKEAGMKWNRIAELIGRPEFVKEGKVKDGGYMVRVYKAFCAENDRVPMTVNPATYQRNFAGGFVSGVRQQMGREVKDRDTGSGTDLVLRDIRKVVGDAAQEMFGKNNQVARYRNDNRKVDWAARAAGQQAGLDANVSGHTSRRVTNRKAIEG